MVRRHGFPVARFALAMLVARLATACILPEYKEEETPIKSEGTGGSGPGTGGMSLSSTTGTGGIKTGTGGTKAGTGGIKTGTGGAGTGGATGTGGIKVSTGGSGGSSSCTIGTTSYPSGAVNTSSACQYCNPAQSVTSWSLKTDGSSCGSGSVCYGGACSASCYIGSSLYTSGVTNSSNKCQVCQPASSTSAWSSAADGTSCATGSVCYRGSCNSGCWIGSTYYATGASNPSNSCQKCSSASSTLAWASVSDGTSCGSYSKCASGNCRAYPDLVIDGFWVHYYQSGTTFTICLNSDTSGNAISNGDYVKVKNRGSATADPFIVRVGLQEVSSGMGHYFTQNYLTHTSSLSSSYVSTWEGPICIAANISNLPATEYRLIVRADYDDEVEEYDEGNNTSTGSSTMSLP